MRYIKGYEIIGFGVGVPNYFVKNYGPKILQRYVEETNENLSLFRHEEDYFLMFNETIQYIAIGQNDSERPWGNYFHTCVLNPKKFNFSKSYFKEDITILSSFCGAKKQDFQYFFLHSRMHSIQKHILKLILHFLFHLANHS